MDKELLTGIWPWWIGGPAIGIFMFLFLIVTGNFLGVSTGLVNLCKIGLPTKNMKFFEKDAFKKIYDWRFLFVAGLILGGFISMLLSGHISFNFNKGFETLGAIFPGYLKYIVLFIGGILIGFGARFAGGCTSGHSIMGISQLETASLVTTFFFMLSGFLVTNIIFYFLGGR